MFHPKQKGHNQHCVSYLHRHYLSLIARRHRTGQKATFPPAGTVKQIQTSPDKRITLAYSHLQNLPDKSAKRPVSQCQTAHSAQQRRPSCTAMPPPRKAIQPYKQILLADIPEHNLPFAPIVNMPSGPRMHRSRQPYVHGHWQPKQPCRSRMPESLGLHAPPCLYLIQGLCKREASEHAHNFPSTTYLMQR